MQKEKQTRDIGNPTIRRRTNSKSGSEQTQRLKTLLFYTLSVIIVCLTAFNFYLFCWIWSSLNGSEPVKQGKEMASTHLKKPHHQARLNLLSSWNSIKFNGRLAAKRSFQVDRLKGSNKRLKIMSPKGVLFSSNKGTIILDLKSKEKRINFPAGLAVISNSFKRRNDSSFVGEDNELLVCSREPETSCQIKVPFVSLTNVEGVNFAKRSIQTSKVETRRLHSAINSLNVLSTNQSIFESTGDKVHLFALDELNLLSRTSSVST